ncbi:hypothetical protein HJ052_11135 [Vibrio parahaemolyticus]|nr:hypothetical protein [Vibrio parahaemolyticus]
MNNAIYMEVDLFDGKYKTSDKVKNVNDYCLGDLVIFSKDSKPNGRYSVKCFFNEKIIYDSLVKVGRYKRGYCFQLHFSESKLTNAQPVYFYGKKIKNIELPMGYAWVLQESSSAEKILDSLELTYGYNPLGETSMPESADT